MNHCQTIDCFPHAIWPTQVEITTNGEANEEILSNCFFRPENDVGFYWWDLGI